MSKLYKAFRIITSKFICGFGLRELGLGRGDLRLGLAHAPLSVCASLRNADLALSKLFLKHCDLSLSGAPTRFSLLHGCFCLMLTRTQLIVIEDRYDLSSFDLIAFAYGDFTHAPGSLRCYRRFVGFDPSAQGDDLFGRSGRA